jgi:hypothetical protein
MASEVKTNKISPATSGTVTLGDASDVFQLPASAEIDIASGATLDVNGTIDLTGATTTGFPAGGLTTASQWRLTTDFTADTTPIASNLEEVDAPVGFGVLGSSMTESSGIFTFPSTGYWLIKFFGMFYLSAPGSSTYNRISIETTTNDSTYAVAGDGSIAMSQQYDYSGAVAEYIFDVTDTANCKCRFTVAVQNNAMTTMGNTDQNETYMTFLRLADT